MTRFQFELDGVLRQRKNTEHIAQKRLAEAVQTLTLLQDQLKRLDEGVQAVNQQMREKHLTGSIDVSLIAQHRRYILGMERQALELARKIAEAQTKVRQAQQNLVEAAKQRKSIEKLRDRQFEQFVERQFKKENEQLDEAGTQIAYQNLQNGYESSEN